MSDGASTGSKGDHSDGGAKAGDGGESDKKGWAGKEGPKGLDEDFSVPEIQKAMNSVNRRAALEGLDGFDPAFTEKVLKFVYGSKQQKVNAGDMLIINGFSMGSAIVVVVVVVMVVVVVLFLSFFLSVV